MPPYFKQATKYTCSLAVLRSVLASRGIQVSEKELIAKIKPDYGLAFENIWNPTIAKLASEYGVSTTMYALWPFLKAELFEQAWQEYSKNPQALDVTKYESPTDTDELGEPLLLAYKDMFAAVRLGCKVKYGNLNKHRLTTLLARGYQIQASIKNSVLYKGGNDTYHSLLIYNLEGRTLTYHDPARYPAMTCELHTMLEASYGTGAFLAFKLL